MARENCGRENGVSGKVYIVGAGPGDPELLTLRAARILGRAGVVLHDALVSAEVLGLAARDAVRIDVGKRCGQKLLTQEDINALLIAYARSYEVVVRLKGGDPAIFGRTGEEITALRDAGVQFEIVPGITASIAAAAAAGISLTDRRRASQVLLMTMHRGAGGADFRLDGVSTDTTIAIYMPGPDYALVAERLREAGWPGDMPCAIVSNVSRENQKIRATQLGRLAEEEALAAPALILVGRVVAGDADAFAAGWVEAVMAERLGWRSGAAE